MSTGRIATRKEAMGGSTLSEIGKIKIGIKATSAKGKEYPKAIDYFRPTGQFANAFIKKFGDQPKELKVVFLSDDVSEVCNQRYECWEGGKRWGWGDGETFTIWDKVKGLYVDGVVKGDPRIRAVGKWDEMLTIRFVLLELPGIMGTWSFQTKAKAVTIPSIVKAFDFVKEKAGTIIGFPFSLTVEMAKGYNPGDPKAYPVVSLVPNFTEDTIEMVQNYIQAGGSINRLTSRMIANNQLDPKVLEIGTGEGVNNG
ncbi:MAG: hypothetical protein Q8R83_05940 [Legionellaceae bacterium]|nr:hypothetical protein [Legionellaceae bacterium]